MRRRGVAIIGTDTGVGKTVVAATLVRASRMKGLEAVPWKPFATGVDPDLITPGEDADLLLRAAGWGAERLRDVSPVRLPLPLAPAAAADAAGSRIKPAEVLAKFPDGGDFTVVEGCGGLLVPINADYDLREFLVQLDLPVVVVARPELGTVNHTLLTVEAARNAGLRVRAVVLSGWPGSDLRTAQASHRAIRAATGLGMVIQFGRIDPLGDADTLSREVNLSDLDLLIEVAQETPRWREDRIGPLHERDRRHVWHPFTQMKTWAASDPVVMERADGPWLIDTDGNRYLDGVSSLWTTVHGHREPAIDEAVRAQLGKVAHTTLLGLASVPSIECAEALLRVAPKNLSRVFYSDSGSTAVEVALKMAFQRAQQVGETKRTTFVRFEGAYHGDTVGAVSVGGIDLFHRIFGPMLFPSTACPAPYAYRRPDGMSEADYAAMSLAKFEDVMRTRGDEVAAVVVEPVMQGAAGMIPQPPGWLPRVAAATKAAGALLVCDEVATGFGRTGKMFAVEHEGIDPDLMCLAKGLTGGYLPLAATLTTERVFEAFLGEPHENRTFFHGHTYTGNPLACAAAIANLRLMKERNTANEAARKGELLGRLLGLVVPASAGSSAARTTNDPAEAGTTNTNLVNHPHVGDVRRRGMMVGIELVKDRATKEPFDVKQRVAWRVCEAAMSHGLRIRPLGDVVVLMPPLGIDDALLAVLVEKLTRAMDDVLAPKETR